MGTYSLHLATYPYSCTREHNHIIYCSKGKGCILSQFAWKSQFLFKCDSITDSRNSKQREIVPL